MPCDYKKYPKHWKEIVAQIRERSGDKCECEGECGHEHKRGRCNAPNHTIVWRLIKKPSVWRSDDRSYEDDWDERPIKVILTTAHLDHDAHNHEVQLDRLRHMCQFCHLNYDKHHHSGNARVTRDKKRGQEQLF